jgi:hypothetical protein
MSICPSFLKSRLAKGIRNFKTMYHLTQVFTSKNARLNEEWMNKKILVHGVFILEQYLWCLSTFWSLPPFLLLFHLSTTPPSHPFPLSPLLFLFYDTRAQTQGLTLAR